MGSLVDTSTVNLLEYLRSKTQIDVDSLDIRGELCIQGSKTSPNTDLGSLDGSGTIC